MTSNAIPSSVTQFTVSADGLNLRSAPRTEADVVKVLARDATVRRVGVSDDGYWYEVRSGKKTGWAAHKYLQPVVNKGPTSRFPWYAIAHAELGVRGVHGGAANPRIVEYLHSTSLDEADARSDETAWCSAFVNWCVERAGFAGTDSAAARSWLSWGRGVETPEAGCVTVLTRGPKYGHAAFFVSRAADQLTLLGGNQSDAVAISVYAADRLLGFRVPS